jgi:hypothetical protein
MTTQAKKYYTVQVHVDARLQTVSSVPVKIFSRFHSSTQYQSCANGTQILTETLPLGQFDRLFVQVGDLGNTWEIKNQLILDGIIVDGIDLNPHNVHLGRQYPDHTLVSHRDPVEYYEPGTHFDYPGVYELDIETPIWKYALYAFTRLSPYRQSLYTSNRDVS